MKQFFTLCAAMVLYFTTNAQVIFEHDFADGMAPYTIVNADGRSVAPNVSTFAEAWVVVPPNPSFGNEKHVVGSTSWLSPPGVADRWLLSPSIVIPEDAPNVLLTWSAKAQDGNFPDGYEVRVSRTGTELEDFEDVIFSINAENTDFTNRGASLDDYVGDTIHFAFRNNSDDMFVLLVGDIKLQSLRSNDVVLTSVNNPRFHLVNEPVVINGTIENVGAEPLTSLDITWTFNGESETVTIDGINVPSFESYTFEHAIPVVVPSSSSFDLTLEVNNPNNDSEVELDNVTRNAVFTGVSQVPFKRVLVEEGTGTWCGWCPRGFVAMENMLENHPETFIGVMVHNGDPMVLAQHDNNMNLSGYPGCNVDRTLNGLGVSQAIFESVHDIQGRAVVPVGVEADAVYDEESRTVNIEALASFYTNMEDADFRFSVIMIEDSVRGTGSSWAQTNFYSFQAANLPLVGYGFNWQLEPDPVPADRMFYNEVSRAIIGGYNGIAGSVPASISDGMDVPYSTEYTVPNNFNPDNMSAVVLVIDGTTGQVMNSVQAKFELSSNVETPELEFGYNVYPNPATDEVTIDIELEQFSAATLRVVNMLGQTIDMKEIGAFDGRSTFNYNVSKLPAGMYTFVVQVNDRIASRKITVQ